jgi:hypothetical protein
MNSLRIRWVFQVLFSQLYSQQYYNVRMMFFIKLFALCATGWLFGLAVGIITLDPVLAVGTLILWAVLNQKTVMKEDKADAQD